MTGGGWQGLDPQCAGSYTPRLSCHNNITFPGEYENIQDNRSATLAQVQAIVDYAASVGGEAQRSILAALEQAQRQVGDLVDDPPPPVDDATDDEPIDEPDDEVGAVLVPESVPEGADTSVNIATGSRWRINVPGYSGDPTARFVTLRRSPSSFVIGHAVHRQIFTKSATAPPRRDGAQPPAHYGRVAGGYNYCGWLRAGTVGSDEVTSATATCSTDPKSKFEVREFASLVNCDPRRNRDGGPKDCVAGALVRLRCGTNELLQNVRPWTTTTPSDPLTPIGNQDVRWRYVTKDGQYVSVQLDRNQYSVAQGRYTFVKRECLPAELPGSAGGTWVPVAGV